MTDQAPIPYPSLPIDDPRRDRLAAIQVEANDLAAQLARRGRQIAPGVITECKITALIQLLGETFGDVDSFNLNLDVRLNEILVTGMRLAVEEMSKPGIIVPDARFPMNGHP